MESVITTPIEDSLSGIEGIKTIKSQSREEVSQITVTFVTGRDVDAAAADVRDRVARVRSTCLPRPSRRSGGLQDRGGRLPDHVDRADQRPALADGADRLRRPLPDRPDEGAARRGHGDHRRRAQVLDARVARPRAARGPGADRAGRRGRAQAPEPRFARRAHREHRPRIHRAGRDRPEERRKIQRHDHLGGERLSDQAQGRRLRRAGSVREPQDRPRQRHHGVGAGRRQAVHRQHAGGRARRQGDAAAPGGGPARRHEHVGGGGHLAVRRGLHQRGVPHDGRGADPGGAGDLPVPAQLARDADSGGHDPGIADRRILLPLRARASRSTC